MSSEKQEAADSLLGGVAIILLGILIFSSAVWGIVENVASINGGASAALFMLLGIASMLIGAAIFLRAWPKWLTHRKMP